MVEISPSVMGHEPNVQRPHCAVGQVPPKPTVINALRLAKASVNYPKWQRARDAAGWVDGTVTITPTIKLAAVVFGVSVPLVKARLGLRGNSPRIHRGNGATVLSDSVLEHLVAEVGIERVWRVLDKLTQPELPLQAAE